jgi:hypothetical protein
MPICGSGKLFRLAAGGLFRIQRWSAVVALLEVPRESRAAICLVVRVVSLRNRAARASLAGSFFGRVLSSVPLQPNLLSSSEIMRSALDWTLSNRIFPVWCSPWVWPNRSSSSCRNCALPKHQPRRI